MDNLSLTSKLIFFSSKQQNSLRLVRQFLSVSVEGSRTTTNYSFCRKRHGQTFSFPRVAGSEFKQPTFERCKQYQNALPSSACKELSTNTLPNYYLFLLLLFFVSLFFFLHFLSTFHFDIMQYRRAKKITSISTKYILFVTIKGCIYECYQVTLFSA